MRWLALALLVGAQQHAEPRIVDDRPGYDRCEEELGGRPCRGRLLTVLNPGRRMVEVTLQCAHDGRTNTTVQVGPKARVRVDIGLGSRPLTRGECYVLSWGAPREGQELTADCPTL